MNLNISTSASFDGFVQVCVNYDDSNMNVDDELSLEMGHYLNGNWEIITESGYPDIDLNKLCGLTKSFSIFALLLSVDSDDDLDGVLNSIDNCINIHNPDQYDSDGDGFGDACEIDTDKDGLIDDIDLCPSLASSENGDIDEDGIGDPCDINKDGDDFDNALDNCPATFNNNQFDFDGDSHGDSCDEDDDNDNVNDAEDVCSFTDIGKIVPYFSGEYAGCSNEQMIIVNCPVNGEYRNHGSYVNCVVVETAHQVNLGVMNVDEKGYLISIAAESDIGKKRK